MIYKLIDYLLDKFTFTNTQASCIIIMVTNHLNKNGLDDMISYLQAVRQELK
jgi:hypothetical protein